MGRLNLHMILSFAQYERELAGERIRDKFAASRKRGCGWAATRRSATTCGTASSWSIEAEAALVRHIFERFLQVGSATKLVQELNAAGHRTKRGKPFDKGRRVQAAATIRTYVGEVEHKGAAYPGEHEAIIDRDTWDKVHAILAENAHGRASRTRAATPALLKGLIFGPDGKAMAPSHTRRRGRLYRFYRTATSLKLCHDACPIRAVPAGEVEAAVINQIRVLLRAPEVVVRVWRAAQLDDEAIDEREVVEALQRLDPLWNQLFPAEQARILQLLVARVVVRLDGLEISLRVEGITSLVEDLRLREEHGAAGGMTEIKLSPDGSTITVFVPMAWRRRGGRKVIVAPPGCDDWAPPPKIDRALVKALARAHRWQRMLESGEYGTLAELADAERISRSYVCRVLRLTLLAPDIVERILDGRPTAGSRSS